MSPIPIDNVTKSEHSWLLWLKTHWVPTERRCFCNARIQGNQGRVVCIRKGIVNCCTTPHWSALFKVGRNYQTSWRYVRGAWEALSHSPRYEPMPCWACLEHSTKLTFHLVNQILPLVKHKFYGWCCVEKVTGNNGFKLNNYKLESNVEYFGTHIE